MSKSTSTATNGGISMVGLLGVILVVLKVLGYSHLSWMWTLAPFWIPISLALAILGVCGLILLAAAIFGALGK